MAGRLLLVGTCGGVGIGAILGGLAFSVAGDTVGYWEAGMVLGALVGGVVGFASQLLAVAVLWAMSREPMPRQTQRFRRLITVLSAAVAGSAGIGTTVAVEGPLYLAIVPLVLSLAVVAFTVDWCLTPLTDPGSRGDSLARCV